MLLVEQMLAEGLDLSEYRNAVWCLDTQSETDLPDNFRTMFSPDRPSDPAIGMDPGFAPSMEGMSTLNLSGSGQFSMRQLGFMAEALRELTNNEVKILDVRQESHLLVDGKPVSLFGKNNRANIGLSADDAERQEVQQAQAIRGNGLEVALPLHETAFDSTCTLPANRAFTERQAAQMLGFGYQRIAVTDRSWPSSEQVDQFVEFVKSTDRETWVHVHCKAGLGRTGEFMVMYDIMRNPQVPLEDIVYRQFHQGSAFMLYEGSGHDWTDAFDQERARMLRKFHQYVQENCQDGFATSWSDWLASA